MCPKPNTAFYKAPKGTWWWKKCLMGRKLRFYAFVLPCNHSIYLLIILYIICSHQGAIINMQAIEIAFEWALAFYFEFSITCTLCIGSGGTDFTRQDICLWHSVASQRHCMTSDDIAQVTWGRKCHKSSPL